VEHERQGMLESGRHLDHLSWRVVTQEEREGSSGSDQTAEGVGVAGLLDVDRNAQDGIQGDQVTLGTGERTLEFISADMSSTCEVVRHLEETPGQPDGAQGSPDLSWS
jgi:hypothetical protein